MNWEYIFRQDCHGPVWEDIPGKHINELGVHFQERMPCPVWEYIPGKYINELVVHFQERLPLPGMGRYSVETS